MLHKMIIGFVIVCVACLPAFSSNEQNLGTGSGQDFSVYFLRTDHPLSKFAPASFPSIEDIILQRNHENKILNVFDGNWRKDILSESEYETSSEDKCTFNNGNCAHKCETIGNEAVCSCDEGFSLIDGTKCYQNISGNVLLSGTSGKFWMDAEDKTWIITAPKNHIIELEIVRDDRMPQHEYSYSVYDSHTTKGNSLSRYINENHRHKFRSSGPYLTIKTGSNWNYDDVFATYKTGLPYFSNSYHRDCKVSVSSLSTGLRCYSATYKGSLHVRISGPGFQHSLPPHRSFEHHQWLWKTGVFQTLVQKENVRLDFSFSSEAQVLMLRECLDIEYFWDRSFTGGCMNGGVWINGPLSCKCPPGFVGRFCEEDLNTGCENGGVRSTTSTSCKCPPGFTGQFCEEGCGPNRYGKNCSKICSGLSTGCQGAIFCREKMCTCAPGFYGKHCDLPCPEGYYGASCKQNCGKCNGHTNCDRYTGECHTGCELGYYPPLCKKTYNVLTRVPDIHETGYRHLKLWSPLLSVSGQGQPKYYQVQYKVEDEDSWSKLTPRKISNGEYTIIENLLPGHFYSVRIILIDKDGGSCELNVPEIKAMTKCIEPLQAAYSLTAKDISEDELTVEWAYFFDRDADFCLVKHFELSLMTEDKLLLFSNLQKDGNKTLSGLLPNTNYRIQLTGITHARSRISSQEITVHTLPVDPGKVVNVQIVPLESSRELKITWQPPRNSAGIKMEYQVTYTCLRILACDIMDHAVSSQYVTVETSALLGDLQPHALYEINIAALTPDGTAREGYIINTTTDETAPQVAPSIAENPVLSVTNESASVTWLPPRDCDLLNGYLYGYSYKLVDNETGQVLKESTVKENVQFVNFTSLKPNHCYNAQIAVVTSGGVDLSNELVIPFCTSPTAPSAVQFLKVYKRSRKMVGLKWGRPLHTYGEIDSFVISYSEQGTDRKMKTAIKPQHCSAWKDFYCHTISQLSPARKYSFTVQARNDKVNADGEPASVEAVTTEGASAAPVNLKVVNATESSVTLQWQLPENINGNLRSFIIMTEQLDTKGASDECCDSIPLEDYRVTSEEPFYRYEISGLSAASTYSVTVAAKTVTLGDEAYITAHTQPPKDYIHAISESLKVQPAK